MHNATACFLWPAGLSAYSRWVQAVDGAHSGDGEKKKSLMYHPFSLSPRLGEKTGPRNFRARRHIPNYANSGYSSFET